MTRASGRLLKVWVVFGLAVEGGFWPLTAASLSPATDGRIGYDTGGASPFPAWSGGALNIIENNSTARPRILSFNRNGQQVSWGQLSIPGATKISVQGFGRSPDGASALCGLSWDDSGREAAFVSWLSPDGQTERTIRTNPYTPYVLTVAPDNTVWTVGLEMVNRREDDPAVDRNAGVLRHFDRTGKTIASFIARSRVPKEPDGSGLTHGFLASSSNLIGWYANNGRAYVEVSSEGVVRYYPGLPRTSPERPTGLGITNDGVTLLSEETPARAGRPREWKIYALDRVQSRWVPVDVPGDAGKANWGSIYGTEGNSLVLSTADRFAIKFFFVSQ